MRRIPSTRFTHLMMLIVLAITAFIPITAGAENCGQQLDEEIARLAVPAERINHITVIPTYGQGSRLDGFEGWAVLNDCTGNLVIKFDKNCHLRAIYTTYKCTVPGVRNY